MSRRTHASHASKVILGGLVLLILIDPLVEVGLEEVDLLVVLQQAGPELLLQLLLPQNQLDVLGRVVDLALLLVDLSKELELQLVRPLEGVRVAAEAEALWLQLQLEVGRLDIRDVDGEVDEVLGGILSVRALRPEDCGTQLEAAGSREYREAYSCTRTDTALY